MLITKYLKRRWRIWQTIIAAISLLFITVAINLLLIQNYFSLQGKTTLLSNALLTIQSIHNQLYFLFPLISATYLLLFIKPIPLEFFWLTKRKQLVSYISHFVLICLGLLIASIFLANLGLVVLVRPRIDNFSSVLPALVKLLIHLLSWYLILFALFLLSIRYNKLIALMGMAFFLIVDDLLFATLHFSLFLTNGLAFPSTYPMLSILSGGCLYLAYYLLARQRLKKSAPIIPHAKQKLLQLVLRNWLLFWHYNRLRLGIISLFTIALCLIYRLQGFDASILLHGVLQNGAGFNISFTWLYLVLSPSLIIGNSIRILVRRDYLQVAAIDYRIYLFSLYFLLLPIVLSQWFPIWLLLNGPRYWPFLLVFLIVTYLFTVFAALIQIYLGSIPALLVMLTIFILTTANNQLPLSSLLMFARYQVTNWSTQIIWLILFIILLGVLTIEVKHINFANAQEERS